MSPTIKVGVSALVAGVIAWGGAFMAAAGGDGPLTQLQVTIAIVTGVVAAAKDIQAYLAKSPS